MERAGTSSRTRQLHFILCCRFPGAGKPQALGSVFPGEHLPLITAQLPLGVWRGSVALPVTSLPGIFSLGYFHSSPRFLSSESHQCSSVSRGSCSCDLASGWHFCASSPASSGIHGSCDPVCHGPNPGWEKQEEATRKYPLHSSLRGWELQSPQEEPGSSGSPEMLICSSCRQQAR